MLQVAFIFLIITLFGVCVLLSPKGFWKKLFKYADEDPEMASLLIAAACILGFGLLLILSLLFKI